MYAEKPYLYGPAASSVNALYVGSKNGKDGDGEGEGDAGLVFEEGGSEEGAEHRVEKGIPGDGASRRKYFLDEGNRRAWEWEAGRSYGCDFYNPYLDFNGMSPPFPFLFNHSHPQN